MPANPRDAYVAALLLLARRELSEAQVRQRLSRRGYGDDEIEAAVARLKAERALDDARTAEAIARTEVQLRGRGRLEADRRMQRAGIAASTATRALDRTYADVDADALLTDALTRRLKGRLTIADQREFNRLYRYLVGRGFESDKVLHALRKRSKKLQTDD